ncbi:MAG: hypothetical protein KGD59_11980 [Candidatus Heimdallarchaeota archaeon]|nr:hypothetical protein [Candidatus Heimdallarchaeota archaeon]MBY8995262.1 hypothetical protein [Candidatus Heimdallarchaeota archaeon]
MTKKIRDKITFLFIFCLIVLSSYKQSTMNVSSQANLVEEEDRYIIYAGNEYTAVIPKDTGPEMIFETENFGEVTLKFDYISEYTSPTQYLNSLNHLSGKGYSLENLNWDSIGSSDINKTYVNLTRTHLDKNTTLDFSLNVFHQNQTIRDVEVKGLTNSYLEFKVNNWSYSPEARGIALNLQAYMEDNENYQRLGPFVDIETEEYAAKILLDNYEFEVRLKSEIVMIKTTGEEIKYTVFFFAHYNVAEKISEPADFWISVPFVSGVNQIIFSFICSIGINQTSPISASSFVSFICGLTAVVVIIRFFVKKRRKFV